MRTALLFRTCPERHRRLDHYCDRSILVSVLLRLQIPHMQRYIDFKLSICAAGALHIHEHISPCTIRIHGECRRLEINTAF